MLIACDVDGVVADLHQNWISRYNADWNDRLTVDKILSWSMMEYVLPECGEHIFDYLDDPSLYDQVVPISGSADGVRQLRMAGHRVVFVTSAVNGCAGRKLRWLQDWHFLEPGRKFDSDYIECHDKSIVRADVLIDDGVHNLRSFIGKRIQFLQPWNQLEVVQGVYLSCDWGEIPDMIEDILSEEEFVS